MQLERILQKHGFGTRKACRGLILGGRVKVGDTVCDDPAQDWPVTGLRFSVDDQEWPYCETACLMLHKPVHYECSRKPTFHPGVLTLLPVPLRERGVQPIGRLDEDTTGLLLITDDGQLNHQLSSAKRKVPKVYLATTKHPLDEGQLASLLAGVTLHDDPVPVRAAGAERVSSHELRLTITEGAYHQVKRMVAAVGNRVESLHREAVGELRLPEDLAPGQWRWLSDADFAALGVTR